MDIIELAKKIKRLADANDRVIVAIDGRCAAGKTTLAEKLKNEIDCNVFHMDDFFLQPFQRTRERYLQAGGNVDYERFYDEVIKGIKSDKPFSYRPFDCKTQLLKEPVLAAPKKISIVEGAYSCHPTLRDSYDMHIFLDVSPNEQIDRIKARNGENALKIFKEKWIPFEEKYISQYDIMHRCEVRM